MKICNSINVLAALSIAAVLSSIPDPASAYIGPGAGITAIGTVLTLFFAVILTLVGFIWYPVKRLIMRRKSPSKPQ